VSLVGLGAMGQRHMRVLGGLNARYEVVGGFDVRADLAVPSHPPRLSSEAEAIARAEVVIVATPIGAHGETVARALAAGRHVLVEKPLCATADQARALEAMSVRGPGRLFVGHSERFNPVVRTLKRLVRDERVLALDLCRVGPSRPTDVGVLLNLGVHDLDLAAYLGGGAVTLRAAVGSGEDGGCGDLAHVLFATAAGAVGHIHVDRTAPTKRRSLALATARWVYEGDLLGHRLVRIARATGARNDVPLPLEEPLVAQALALADALDGHGSREIATGTDGALAVALAERAAYHCTSAAADAEKLSLLGRP
jgi:predicted dehydrogenase